MQVERNPYHTKDEQFVTTAYKAANILWEATGGDLSDTPANYLESLNYTFSDGSVSMLSQLNKVDFSEDTSYDEFMDVVESLMKVDPEQWPESNFTEQIQASKLIHEIESEEIEFDDDFEFAEGDDLTGKMELFFKKVIASVYLDGVTSVTDKEGNPPNMANNFLMDPDGKSFEGIFYDSPPDAKAKKFPFKISEKSDGKWQIRY
jgi:hypothetical protein